MAARQDPARRGVVYHVPRRRHRAPAVVVGGLGLLGLVTAQLFVSGALPRAEGPGPVLAGPTTAATVAGPLPEVPGGDLGSDPPVAPATAAPPVEPVPANGPSAAAAHDGRVGDSGGPRLRPVPVTTVGFVAGAVLDDRATEGLQPVLDVLTSPDAAPVLVTGSAQPGPDEASALRLAQQRAEAVVAELVDAGVPASLLSTAAVVDAGGARAVVLAPAAP